MAAVVWRTGRTAATLAASTTTYEPLGDGGAWQGYTTEARAQSKFRSPGTLSRLQFYIVANDRGASTGRIRKNTANGNIAVSVTASTTGHFEDVVNTDTVSAGDVFNRSFTTGAGGTTLTAGQVTVVFTATTNSVTRLAWAGNLTTTLNNFWPLSGNTSSSVTEAIRQTHVMTGGTFKNGCFSTDSNTRNGNVTFVLRKAGVTTALSISIIASTTGHFEDTTNSSAVLAGEKMTWLVSADAGASGTLTCRNSGIDFETTDGTAFHTVQTGATVTFARNATAFFALSGLPSSSSTEDPVKQQANLACTFTNLRYYTDTNAITSGTSTFKLRVNGADSTLVVSITASATGTFDDVTHSVTVAATDYINFSITVGVGSGSQTLQIRATSIKSGPTATAYDLSCNPGTYVTTGTAAFPVSARVVNAAFGAYALTGKAAGAVRGYPLNAGPGAYTLSGGAASLLVAHAISAAAGSYALTGVAASLVRGLALSASAGAYAVTGLPTSPLAARALNALAGAYAVTGAAASPLAHRVLTLAPGVYLVAGDDDGDFDYTPAPGGPTVYELNAASGSYAVTGAAVTALAARMLNASAGVLVVTGVAAGVVREFVTNAVAGAYAMTGASAGVPVGRALQATAGAYSVAGAPLGMVAARLMTASPGVYALTGLSAGTLVLRALTASGGSYLVTGADASLIAARVLNGEGGLYTLTGIAATLDAGIVLVLDGIVFTVVSTTPGRTVASDTEGCTVLSVSDVRSIRRV